MRIPAQMNEEISARMGRAGVASRHDVTAAWSLLEDPHVLSQPLARAHVRRTSGNGAFWLADQGPSRGSRPVGPPDRGGSGFVVQTVSGGQHGPGAGTRDVADADSRRAANAARHASLK